MPLQLVCLRTPPPHPSRTGQNAKNKSESARGSRQRCFMRWREENERNEPTPPSEAGRLATRPRSRPQLPPALFNRWARAPGSGTRHWLAGAGCPASRPAAPPPGPSGVRLREGPPPQPRQRSRPPNLAEGAAGGRAGSGRRGTYTPQAAFSYKQKDIGR